MGSYGQGSLLGDMAREKQQNFSHKFRSNVSLLESIEFYITFWLENTPAKTWSTC